MKNLNKIIFYNILFLLFICCKSRISDEKIIDISKLPTEKELKNRFHEYDFEGLLAFYTSTDNKKEKEYKVVLFTNVEPNPVFKENPRRLFTPSIEEKNYEYFENKLNGRYVLYLKKEGKITMREYARWYDFERDRHTKDSVKVLSSKMDTDEKIFNYLKQNNIKYKLISTKGQQFSLRQIKILLDDNKAYAYITYSPYYIITNIYYNAKDTLHLNNNFGRSLFR